MTDIGFIGLGIMGRPMAAHLQSAGHRLFLHDVAGLPKDLVAAGAVACDTGKEVADKAEIVILMVPDTPHVEAALFGRNGVAEGLSKGKIVVDMDLILLLEVRVRFHFELISKRVPSPKHAVGVNLRAVTEKGS